MGVGESHWKSSLLSDSLKPKMKLFPLLPALFLSSVPVQVEWRIPTFPVLSQELFGRWSKSYPSLCWIAGTKRGWCQDTFPFSLGYFWRKLHTELQEPSSQVARSASHWHACILKPFLSAKVWESIMANMPLVGWSTHRPSPADQEAVCQRRLLNWPHGESLHEVSEKENQKRSLLWCKQLWNPCIVFFPKAHFSKTFCWHPHVNFWRKERAVCLSVPKPGPRVKYMERVLQQTHRSGKRDNAEFHRAQGALLCGISGGLFIDSLRQQMKRRHC